MTCSDRDPDLLLSGLGELGVVQRLRVDQHLRRCPRCRARQAELLAVSAGIAGVVGFTTAARRAFGEPRIHAPRLAHAGWLGVGGLVLVLLASLTVVAVATAWYTHASRTSIGRAADQGCRPDLPNDLCR